MENQPPLLARQFDYVWSAEDDMYHVFCVVCKEVVDKYYSTYYAQNGVYENKHNWRDMQHAHPI